MSEQDVTLKDVEEAAVVLRGIVRKTPLDTSRTLSELAGMDLCLKMENMQRTGSFKLRGAYNKIHSLSDTERRKGVVAASAGNHAQGVAHAATLLDTRSTIVMPESASPAKSSPRCPAPEPPRKPSGESHRPASLPGRQVPAL